MKKGKKKIALYAIIMVVLCMAVFVVFQLFFKVDPIKIAKANVSEKGTCFFVDSTNDNAVLKVSSGLRENPYNLDGIHNELKPFTLLIFKTTLNGISDPSFSAVVNNVKYEGVLELNPVDATYVYDFGIAINNSAEMEIVVKVNDYEFNFKPVNLNQSWGIDFDEALDAGLRQMEDVINSVVVNNKFNGECYVKVISDPAGVLNIYYYYVGIIDSNGNIYSIILDTATGEKIGK